MFVPLEDFHHEGHEEHEDQEGEGQSFKQGQEPRSTLTVGIPVDGGRRLWLQALLALRALVLGPGRWKVVVHQARSPC